MLDTGYATDRTKAGKQLNKVRRKNDAIARNYCEFMYYWLNKGKARAEPETLAREIINHREWAKDNYSMLCWTYDHYKGLKGSYNELDNYFDINTRWELKRGLGLMLEHSLTGIYKSHYLPCKNNVGQGSKSYDFIYFKNGLFSPIDLKLNFGRKAKHQRNNSKYNLNVLLTLEDITTIFESIKENNRDRFLKVIDKIDEAVKKNVDKKKYIIMANKKSLNEYQSIRLYKIV